MKQKQRKEFEKYHNEQLELLKRHNERIMLRLFNKYMELGLK